jgi:response regulator of citrate/malate metabolism
MGNIVVSIENGNYVYKLSDLGRACKVIDTTCPDTPILLQSLQTNDFITIKVDPFRTDLERFNRLIRKFIEYQLLVDNGDNSDQMHLDHLLRKSQNSTDFRGFLRGADPPEDYFPGADIRHFYIETGQLDKFKNH